MARSTTGIIFSIERHALHDGDGIRTIVYLKGCPLRCLWCANPEGQKRQSQLAFFPERCIACLKCLDACPQGANRIVEGRIEHDGGRCIGCGRCVEDCWADARSLWGKQMRVEEVLAEACKDLPFYRASGGGITLSGGEPASQAVFAKELLQACHEQGIHTCMETCGYAPWPAIQSLLPHLDQVICDLKHMHPDSHARLTGVSNRPILQNVKRIAASGVPMTIRIPVVPGQNDSDDNFRQTAEFVKRLPGRPPIELLPYHSYGSPKYSRLGQRYLMPDIEPPTREQMERWRDQMRAFGVDCEVL